MKKSALIYALIACLILPTVVLVTSAHSGKTDASGGHTNHSTGEYHYHHGYSAHSHYDMDGDGRKDCPYDFDNRTNHISSKNSRNTTSQHKIISPTQETVNETKDEVAEHKIDFSLVLHIIFAVVLFGLYIFIMFILPFIMK